MTGLRSVPRINDHGAQTDEVFHVPGHDGELVVKGGSHDQTVSNLDLFP